MSDLRTAAKAALSLVAPMQTPSPASRLLQGLAFTTIGRRGERSPPRDICRIRCATYC